MNKITLSAFTTLLLLPFVALCQSFTTNGNWNTASNWSGTSVPAGTGVNITLSADPTISTGNTDVIGNISCDNGVDIVVQANASLTLGSSALYNGATKKSLTFVNNGTITINNGTSAGLLEIWGDLIVSNSLTLNVTGKLIVHGNVILNNNSNLSVSGGGTVTIGGSMTGGNNTVIAVTGTNSKISVSGTITLDNGSTMSAASGGTISAVSGCSCTGCSTSPCGALPITLSSFTLTNEQEKISLHWATSQEINFDYFDVERSSDGETFSTITTVKGHGTSRESHKYTYDDTMPLLGKNYYRLKSVDLDGTAEYFKVLMSEFNTSRKVTVTPNPSDGVQINLSFNFVVEKASVTIINNLGSAVEHHEVSSENAQILFLNTLPRGVYYAHVETGDFSQTERFIVR